MKLKTWQFLTKSAKETKKLARRILNKFSQYHIFALNGELGTGKTTFVQGALRNFGCQPIISPTFLIIREYNLKSYNFNKAYHIDCYRIKSKEEIEILGVTQILEDKKALIFIEWAEKIKEILPSDTVFIYFSHQGQDMRKIEIKMPSINTSS